MEPHPSPAGPGEEKLKDPAQFIPLEGSRLAEALDGEDLLYLLPGLPEIEQEVILRRNGLGDFDKETIDRVGQQIGYSREWARQLENSALRRLRGLVEEKRRPK